MKIKFLYSIFYTHFFIFFILVFIHNFHSKLLFKIENRNLLINSTLNHNSTLRQKPIRLNDKPSDGSKQNNTKNFIDYSKVKPANTSIISTCEIQCDKISQIFDCYCDRPCEVYNDCCKTYLPECENYFQQKEIKEFKIPATKNTNSTLLIGSCCDESKPPLNCFCDSKCEVSGDCCLDYKKCKT